MAESSTLSFGEESLADFRWLLTILGPGATNLSVFMLAMAVGHALGEPFQKKYARSNTGPRTEVKVSHQALMSAILVEEGTAVGDFDTERDQLAGRYAEAGIRIIREKIGDSEDTLGDLVLLIKEAMRAGRK